MTHPWLLSKDDDLLNHNLGVNLEQLKLFNARRKLRAAIKSVRVENGMWSLVLLLRGGMEWNEVQQNGMGWGGSKCNILKTEWNGT